MSKLLELAEELDDLWQCAGEVKYWSDEDKRAFIHKAAELAAGVIDHFADSKRRHSNK